MLRIGVADLLARLDLPHGLEPFEGEPVVAVECDGSGGERVLALTDRLRGLPAVVVAVDPPGGDALAAALDVAADEPTLEAIAAAVHEHPEAAITLAVLLRGGADRSIAEGLVAESAAYSLLQAGPDHRRWLAARPAPAPPAATPDHPAVAVDRDGDVLRLVLDRPEVHNAYSAAMRDGLVEALAVAAADEALDVVLEGRGRSFCSGGDLREFGTGPDPAGAHLVRLRRSAGRAIAEIADRVTVRVHGAAIGAGAELAAFAGRVVAAPGARFSLPELSMGLVPGAGGTVSLPRRIGRRRTALAVLTGMTIDAPTAKDWGLVDDLTNWV